MLRGVRFNRGKARAASIFGAATGAPASAAEPAPKARPVPREHILQSRAVDWFRAWALPRGAMLWSSLEGITLDTRGKKRRTPQQQAKIAAIMAVQRAAGMLDGMPDTNWAWPASGAADAAAGTAWIELKAEGAVYGDLRDAQREQILGLLRAGQRVGIAQSMYDIEDLLLGWGVLLRQRLDAGERPAAHPQRQKWPLEGEELRRMLLYTTPANLLREWGHEPLRARASA